MDKTKAEKYSKVLRVAFGVMALTGVVVAAVGMSRSSLPDPAQLKEPELTPLKITEAAGSGIAPDVTGIAARMSAVANSPKPAPPPVIETASTKGPEVPVTPPPRPDEPIKYLGPVSMGGGHLALITVTGKQRFVGINEKVIDESVSAIDPEWMELTRGEGEKATTRKINKEVRGSQVVTVISANRAGGAPGGIPGRAAGMVGSSGLSRGVTIAPPRQPPAAIPSPISSEIMNSKMTLDSGFLAGTSQEKEIRHQMENGGFKDDQAKQAAFDTVRNFLKEKGKFNDEKELDERSRIELDRIISGKGGG